MTLKAPRTITCLIAVCFACGLLAQPAGAQTDDGAFPLTASSAYCEPGFAGPFVGCTPWAGLTVSFVSSDGTFSDSCVTEDAERAAGCTVQVPFGSTITASIDPAAIPAGYELQHEASVAIEIPDGPPEGEFGGATFVLFAQEADETGDDDEGEAVADLPDTGAGMPGDPGSPGFPALLLTVAAGLVAIGARSHRRSLR